LNVIERHEDRGVIAVRRLLGRWARIDFAMRSPADNRPKFGCDATRQRGLLNQMVNGVLEMLTTLARAVVADRTS